ncbi:MAG: ABC transporter ATP-binding protein [Atribacterota bacterium]|nr:ABC transporter ATP-binding protein [Atribacterota bacterium]
MIKIKNLTVKLDNFLLKDICLDIQSNDYFIILGPTGAGKTVLLESIAGLYPLSFGEIWLDQKKISLLKPEKRQISMVYQDQMLFPHLSVRENIAFGLKLRRYHVKKIKEEIENIAKLLEILFLLDRKPSSLSGGEKQRVALARALVIKPRLLLLDEPLSALDAETKERMQRRLKEIHQYLKVAIIHVTHHFTEALALGTRAALLNQGSIEQIGTPEEFLRHPCSEFAARFVLARNIFSAQVVEGNEKYSMIQLHDIKLEIPYKIKGNIKFILRPEDIFISKEKINSNDSYRFLGVISHFTNQGSFMCVTVSIPPDFICLVTRLTFEEMSLREGVKVWINFKHSALHIFK